MTGFSTGRVDRHQRHVLESPCRRARTARGAFAELTRVLILGVTLFPVIAQSAQQPVDIDVEGVYVNDASGFVFPETIGAFQRTGVTSYNELENNISAGYAWRGGPVPTVVSVFIFAIPLVDGVPMSLEEQFESEESGVRAAHPGTLDVATDEATVIQNGIPVRGLMTEFILPPSPGGWDSRVGSILFLFQHETWSIKVRATFPEHEAKLGREISRRFLDAFSWTGAVPRDADAILHNCTIRLTATVAEQGKDVLAAWIVYGKARVAWRRKNTFVPILDGPEPSTFEEEVDARELLLIGWKAVHGSDDPYLETLKRVKDASFLPEYVHTYLVQNPAWVDHPPTERLDAFDAWREQHLAGHEPVTHARLDCR